MVESFLRSRFGMQGKKVAITGASRGIGLAIAASMAAAGGDVIGISHTMPEKGSKVGEVVESLGAKFVPMSVDLSNRAAVAELGERLAKLDIDVLVNNGGTIRRAAAAEHSDQDFDYVMEVNLRSAWVLSRAVGAMMIDRGSGKIINTASMLSFQGGINVPGYTSSKSALAGLTKALANEWASKGVNVNAVAPGYIATDNTTQLREDRARSTEILSRIPAGRWGKPEDIGDAVLFLASNAADYINGAILPVDGGWLAR